MASPVCVLRRLPEIACAAKPFRQASGRLGARALLCGLPRWLVKRGLRRRASRVADALSRRAGAARFADERLSSQEAKRSLREKGLTAERRCAAK